MALSGLAGLALENARFVFKKPVFPDDDDEENVGDEGEGDGGGDIVDFSDMNQDMSDDEDIAENVELQIEPTNQVDAEEREMIKGEIDPDDWKREV